MHQLVEAETLLDQRSYAEAAGIVGGILADTADYGFSFDHSQSLCRRLKPAAEALLARFPPEGRQEYELRFGDMARGRLAEAVAAQSRPRWTTWWHGSSTPRRGPKQPTCWAPALLS